jgi:predicted esterase
MTDPIIPPVHTIEARTHGRYLVRAPATPSPWPVLVGFHGYAETAGDHLDALVTIPGSADWLLVSVQALHPFYTRAERVVASWMTRDDRDLAIADNVDYVGRVLDRVRQDHRTRPTLVFSGFSQGGAMAYRAAATYRADGLIILGADAPPDVLARPAFAEASAGKQVGRLPPILIGRGTRDHFYTEGKHAADLAAFARIDARVTSCVFDGGHEWSDEFRGAAAEMLTAIRAGS